MHLDFGPMHLDFAVNIEKCFLNKFMLSLLGPNDVQCGQKG